MGYYRISLVCDDGITRKFLVSRLIAAAFHGLPKKRQEVHHKDHNRLNNNADNLEWGTHMYNIQEAVRMGRMTGPVLTPQQRQTLKDINPVPCRSQILALAKSLHVTPNAIRWHIKHRR